MFEILGMLLHGSAERVRNVKFFTMIEAFPAEDINSQPSPRIMNSHLPPRLVFDLHLEY